MATPAQIEANRANAQKSTGPRTGQGKARSAQNNFHHGFRSQSVLAPGDDPAAYEAILDELTDHFTPRDLTEERSVREMADAEWRLRRVRRQIEDLHWEEFEKIQTQFPDLPQPRLELRTLESLHQPGALYPRLLTFEARSERQYDRAYRSWRNYQGDRRHAEAKEIDTALKCIGAGLPIPSHPAPGPDRTNEPNFISSAPGNRTFEPNSAAAPAQNRTNEPKPAPANTPRNAPCPCGSGQKFKRCCGRNAPPVLFPDARAA